MATPIPENRARFTLGELAAATGGRLVELDADAELAGVSTDSRTVRAGNLFVALRGGAHDAHAYVDTARGAGATVLVARDARLGGPRIEVDDTLVALGAIARAFVERSFAEAGARPVLAVGGAAGKTSTKTLAAAAASALFGDTLVTAGNLNNRIGVPMTLLALEPSDRAIVVECGTSEKGEIAALGAIVRPDVALVTNVGIEHSAGLGSLEQIADEEAALFGFASRAAITSDAEPLLLERLARSNAPLRLAFGTSERADVRIVRRTPREDGRTELHLVLGERLSGASEGAPATAAELSVVTPLLGPAAATNVAAATAGALALLDRPASGPELAALAAALGAVEAVPGRLVPRPIGGILALDDTYNSNPKSIAAALAAALEIAECCRAQRPDHQETRLVLALGDMLELGELSIREHEKMIADAAATGAALLVLVGEECGKARARMSFATPFHWFSDSTAAATALLALVRPGDVVLVKGSRGMRMERLLEALQSESTLPG